MVLLTGWREDKGKIRRGRHDHGERRTPPRDRGEDRRYFNDRGSLASRLAGLDYDPGRPVSSSSRRGVRPVDCGAADRRGTGVPGAGGSRSRSRPGPMKTVESVGEHASRHYLSRPRRARRPRPFGPSPTFHGRMDRCDPAVVLRRPAALQGGPWTPGLLRPSGASRPAAARPSCSAAARKRAQSQAQLDHSITRRWAEGGRARFALARLAGLRQFQTSRSAIRRRPTMTSSWCAWCASSAPRRLSLGRTPTPATISTPALRDLHRSWRLPGLKGLEVAAAAET